MNAGSRTWAAPLGAAVAALFVTVAAVAAAAFACVGLATLALSAGSGPGGARLTATGTGYPTTPDRPVVVRWNGTDGAELGRTVPNAKGEISLSFTVPSVAPGYYVVVAVQRDAQGVDAYGTPSRATFQVLGTGPAPATTVAAPLPTTVAPPTVPPTTRLRSTTTSAAGPRATTAPLVAPTAPTSAAPVAARPVVALQAPRDRAYLPPEVVALSVVLLGAVALGLGVARSALRGARTRTTS